MEQHYLECQCSQAEHTLRFTLDNKDGDLYTEVYLNRKSLFQRILTAIKYVFGWQSKYGAFDCTILKVEDYDKLRELLAQSEKILADLPYEKRPLKK